jgi:hypothetical protein
MRKQRRGASALPSPREAVVRVGSYRDSVMSRGGGLRVSLNYFPHPQPLPTTRFVRGGRGAVAPRGVIV